MANIDLSNVDTTKLQGLLTPRLTKYVPYEPTAKQSAFLLMNNQKEILYGGAAGGGKALSLDTPILTDKGWSTMGELRVGDHVYDEKGRLCNVIAKSDVQVNHKVYKVIFDKAESIIADAEHIWTLSQYQNRPCNKDMTTQEIFDTLGKRAKHAISVVKPLHNNDKQLPVPPYTLGVWLGDGSKSCGDCAAQDAEIYTEVEKDGYYTYEKGHKVHVIKGLYHDLNNTGLLNNKHIPQEYLTASYEQRLALLQGLMDTDGNASSDRGYCSISMVDKELMQSIAELVCTFGIKVSLTESVATCSQTGAKRAKYTLKWFTEIPMFRLPYKLAKQKVSGFRGTQYLHYIIDVVPVESVPVQCIKVDSPSSLFLAGKSLVPTHNSVAQLMAALQFVDIPGYSAILFRKTYADLSLPGALIDMSKQWLMPFVEAKEVSWSEKEKRYVFPSGASLSFGYLESANDCYRYQGAEFQYIGMDEVTHIDPANYRYLFSRLRKPKSLNVPLRFRATANPGGQFGEYYYNRFFKEGKENGRVFIGAGLDDNPYLDAEQYKESLSELDPVTREQLLNGNWEIKGSGDMFSRHWFQVVPEDDVPQAAQSVRFWDFAATDPKKRKSKDKREPDWTVGFKMSYYQGMYWIRDIVRVQKTPAEAEKLMAMTAEQDGYSCAIRMEQEPGSSGQMTVDHIGKDVVPGYDFKGILTSGSKVERARAASSAAERGVIFITQRCRNLLPFFDELDIFPFGVHDDTIDGLSGSFNHFRKPAIQHSPSGVRKKGGSYWKQM